MPKLPFKIKKGPTLSPEAEAEELRKLEESLYNNGKQDIEDQEKYPYRRQNAMRDQDYPHDNTEIVDESFEGEIEGEVD